MVAVDDDLRRRDALLEAVGFAAERLLGEVVGWDPSVRAVLRRLGEATGACRVAVTEDVADAGARTGWEWARRARPAPGRPPPGHLAVPILVEGRRWGQFTVEACTRERTWSPAEVGAFGAVAGTLGAALRRRRIEEELRRREEEYRAIFELAGVGKAQADPASGKLLRVNPKLCEITGYPPEELLGRTFWELVHDADRERGARGYRRLLRGEIPEYSVEQRYLRRDGQLVWVSVNTTVSRDPQGRPLRTVATIQDVTERRQAEEARKESEERFRSAFESTPIGMALVRLDGRWVDVNQPFLDLVGYSADEMLDRTFQDITHPDDLEADLANMRRLLAGEIPSYQMEKRYLHAEGHAVWVLLSASLVRDADGTPLYGIAQVEDVTQRKRDAERLRSSEALYRAVVEQANENIFLVDVATRRIVETNPAFRRTFGYSGSELRGLTVDRLTAGRDQPAGSGDVLAGQRRYRRADGGFVDVDVSASTVRRHGRDTVCVVAHDVTDRARVQELLEHRVAALSRLSASLSLDLAAEPALGGVARSVMTASTAAATTVVLADQADATPRVVGWPALHPEQAAAVARSCREPWSPFSPPSGHRPRLAREAWRGAATDARLAALRDRVGAGDGDVVFSVPLVARGRVLGTIHFHYPPGGEPGQDEQVFLGAVADQTAVAVENARLFAEVRGKAALEERQRLARELHDSVSQVLYGIALGARTARELADRDPGGIGEPLEYVLAQAEAGLAEMRALIFELRPESLAAEGLVAALAKQAAALEARHGLQVDTVLPDEPEVALQVKEALYRIAQEALNNVVKHAAARRLEIRLDREADGLVLEVTDDGRGFDAAGAFPGHLGLRSMQERAGELGGRVEIRSAPWRGTRVRAAVPLTPTSARRPDAT